MPRCFPTPRPRCAQIVTLARRARRARRVARRGHGHLRRRHADGATACMLVLTRMRRILAVDAAARTRDGGAGRAQRAGDGGGASPRASSSRPIRRARSISSIGGNVAENAGGVHCLKYGLTVAQRGRPARDRRRRRRCSRWAARRSTRPATTSWRSSPAARATSASSRAPRCACCRGPKRTETLLAAFRSVKAGAEAVGAIIGAGVIPGGARDDGPRRDRRVRALHGAGASRRPRRCCSWRWTAAAEETPEIAARGARGSSRACGATEVRVAAGRRGARRTCGSRARAPSPRSRPSCPTTTRWTARSRAAALPEVLERVYALGREYGMVDRQRLPRGRRQHPPVHLLRREQGRRAGEERGAGRAHPRALRRARRHDHRRARRRHREAAPDVRAVPRAARSPPSTT